MTEQLEAQFAFLLEADKLRQIDRQNLVLDGSRCENSAEHSWHLALYAIVFSSLAPEQVDINRVLQMLLLHDLVEIDVGDHPIANAVDWAAVTKAEQEAARRLFELLPPKQGNELLALWQEFENAETPDARFAKHLDHSQPVFQTLSGCNIPEQHVEIAKENLLTGRASNLRDSLPEIHSKALSLLDLAPKSEEMDLELAFLAEADRLKHVNRATLIGGASRRENSAEHSWHVMLYAWILQDHAAKQVDLSRVLKMLLIHDLVEIDAGDTPIHGAADPQKLAQIEAAEQAAAKRLFGLLPSSLGQELHTLWNEFEAAETPDAVFAKSIDRVQPVLLNLINGGGSWIEYQVTLEQLESRVGQKVTRGTPDVWAYVRSRVVPWFEAHS